MIIPRILSLHAGQLKGALLPNHRTIVNPFIGHRLGTFCNRFKGKGFALVRAAPLRLRLDDRRIGQDNRDHDRPRKPLCIVDRQLVIGLSRCFHIAQIQCRSGCPINHLPPLAPLVGQ